MPTSRPEPCGLARHVYPVGDITEPDAVVRRVGDGVKFQFSHLFTMDDWRRRA